MAKRKKGGLKKRFTNEGADGREEGLAKKETLGTKGPTRIRVQNGDHHGHVRAANLFFKHKTWGKKQASFKKEKEGGR